MEKERDISKHLEIISPEYREFYALTVSKLNNENGFSLSVEGHTAGHLCQAILGSATIKFSEEDRKKDIIRYLEYVTKEKGGHIIKYFIEELKFPLPEGFIFDK